MGREEKGEIVVAVTGERTPSDLARNQRTINNSLENQVRGVNTFSYGCAWCIIVESRTSWNRIEYGKESRMCLWV